MAGYERQVASAKRMIAKRGQAVSWLVRSVGTTDPDEVPGASKWRPKNVPGVDPVERPVVIAFLPLEEKQREALRGRGIADTSGMEQGFMAQVPFSPNQKDAVLRDGRTLPIESIDIIAPNGTAPTDVILYTVIFKAPVVISGGV